MSPRRDTGRCGFTLIELVVVLALLGLATVLVMPMVSSGAGRTEVKAAAREIAAGLREARSAAIVGNRDVGFLLDVETGRYRIEGREARTLTSPANLSLYAARSEQRGESAAAVRFYPDGSSTGGQIALSSDDAEYRVTVDWLTGRIMLLDYE